MRKHQTLIFFFSFIFFSSAFSQNKLKIDSLNLLLTKSLQDSNRVLILSQLCDEHEGFNPDKALKYGKEGLSLSKKLNYKKGIALCLNKIGVVYFHKGAYKEATINYWEALKINEETGNKKEVADNLSNIGSVYVTQENYEKALEYNLQSLKIDEELGNKYGIASSHINIGNIYYYSENYPKALRYYQLALNEGPPDKQNKATVLSNMGVIYFTSGDYTKAIGNFNQAIKISEEIGDRVGIATDFYNIGESYYKQKDYKKSIEYYKKSLSLAIEISAKDLLRYNYEGLSIISQKTNNYKAAFEYHKLYSDIKDTLMSAEINKQIEEMAIKYETEKKEKENALLKKETTKQYTLNKRQKEKLNYLMIGLIILAATGVILFIRSRSKQKTNEVLKELIALKTEEENELRKAKNAVEQSMKLKEQFLANISHEIRTPLNAIIGFTDLLHKGNLGLSEKEYIHFIKTAGENLINIVNDILDMSKIEAGMISFEEKSISIFDLFKGLEVLSAPRAKEKGLELSFTCCDSTPKLLTGDPTRFTQIFINLIGNAIKFTERGEIKITAKLLKEESDSVFIEFSVKDTGIGIPEEKLNFVFERFTQAEAYTTRKYEGTGLGLSIVKHLVELQKGTISVASEIGKGSEFKFVLPFKHATEVPEAPIEISSKNQKLSKLSVLLAEDNILNIKLTQALFANTEVDLDVAKNGKEAIEQLEKKNYDLILMDMQMPEMDGYQATTYIRETLKNDIPIIAMTAHAMTGEREKCLLLGMNEYVPKPINANFLFERINILTNSSINKGFIKTSLNNSDKYINLNYLIQTVGIKTSAVKEMLDDFTEQFEEDYPVLTNAVSKEDYATIENLSHKLKSPASMMGMSRMEKLLIDIEALAASNESIEKIRSHVTELNYVSQKVLEEIEIEKTNLS